MCPPEAGNGNAGSAAGCRCPPPLDVDGDAAWCPTGWRTICWWGGRGGGGGGVAEEPGLRTAMHPFRAARTGTCPTWRAPPPPSASVVGAPDAPGVGPAAKAGVADDGLPTGVTTGGEPSVLEVDGSVAAAFCGTPSPFGVDGATTWCNAGCRSCCRGGGVGPDAAGRRGRRFAAYAFEIARTVSCSSPLVPSLGMPVTN